MRTQRLSADIVMLGTFSAWNLGTIQARALPLAEALVQQDVKVAIVTTPWDLPEESGVVETIGNVLLANTRSSSTSNPLPAVVEQMRWVQSLRPNLVHVLKPRGFGGLAGRVLKPRFPVLVDSDDWEGDGGWNDSGQYSWPQRRVFQWQETDMLRRADRVTAASTLLAQRAVSLRGNLETTTLIRNGLPGARIATLHAARRYQPSRIDPAVVTLYSRFAEFERSWVATFVEALAAQIAKPVTVRVIGRDRLPEDPALWTGDVKTEILGYVASREIPGLLASSSLAIFPYRDSLITRSKQSVKLLELMAAGCPVIASDVGDVAQTVGSSGCVVPGGSPAAFAGAATSLLNSPQQLDAMCELGAARAFSHYRIESIASDLLRTYRLAGLT